MREFTRRPVQGKRTRLLRGADGRLKSASSGTDVADIWAEQRRIRLAEAIQENARRAERRAQRAALVQKLTQGTLRAMKRAPRLLWHALRRGRRSTAAANPSRRTPKRLLIGGAGAAILVVAAGGVWLWLHAPHVKQEKMGTHVAAGVLQRSTEQPTYDTVLPSGRTIEQLGGWRRVSPPDKDPVFAFADAINGVPITVSEQPLPASFTEDVAGSIAKLAKDFTANDKITTDDLTAYIGTSVKGPQSVILAKDGLLILIKSNQKIQNDLWGVYISSLQ